MALRLSWVTLFAVGVELSKISRRKIPNIGKYKFDNISEKADDYLLITTGAVLILDDTIYPMIKDWNF